MKRILLFFIAIISIWQSTFAYNFGAVAPSGQMLYYQILTDSTVAITYQIDGWSLDLDAHYNPTPSGNLIIPDSVTYNGNTYIVTSIIDYALQYCSELTSLTIPESMRNIGAAAFKGCGMDTINYNAINCTIFDINNSYNIHSFYGCNNVTSLNIGSNVSLIPTHLCDHFPNLVEVNIGNGVTSIPNNFLSNNNELTTITIPQSVTLFGTNVFDGCIELTHVYYSGSIAQWCSITFGNELSNPIYYAKRLYLNDSSPAITNLTIPSWISEIKHYAFINCTTLVSIVFPNSITMIGQQAFAGCSGLNSITMKCYPPNLYTNSFTNHTINIPVHVPCGALSSYMNAGIWSTNFTHFVEDCTVITVTANDYTLGGVTGGGTFTAGDTVTLTAIPYFGSRFIGWSNGSQENPLTFVATTNQNFVAAFGVGELPHDTVYIHDTTYINNYIHDTIVRHVNHYIHDTTFVNNYIYDTIYLNHYFHDTTFINNYIYDTIYLYRYIYDTVYIHDTIYIQEGEGIDNIALLNAKIYQRNGQIVVEGAEGYTVCLYDVVGRLLATRREAAQEVLLDVPASGAYLVKIGDAPARRIVVKR